MGVLFYNKEIFDKAGVAHPTNEWTWEDVLAAAKKLTDTAGDKPTYGLVSDIRNGDYGALIYQNGGTLVDSLENATAYTLADPATVQAVQWYADLALVHEVMPTPGELRSSGGAGTMIASGRAAMWYGVLGGRGTVSGDVPLSFDWGVVAPPAGKERITWLNEGCYVLGKQAAEPLLGWQWAKFLAQPQDPPRGISPLRSVVESDAFLASEPPEVAAAARAALAIARPLPSAYWVNEMLEPVYRGVNDVFSGEPAEEALATAQERATAALARLAAQQCARLSRDGRCFGPCLCGRRRYALVEGADVAFRLGRRVRGDASRRIPVRCADRPHRGRRVAASAADAAELRLPARPLVVVARARRLDGQRAAGRRGGSGAASRRCLVPGGAGRR